MHFLAC
ncbi:unnamed protein product [Lasius platythorax]